MSYKQELRAKLDYQAAQETSIIHPNKGGSHTSAVPDPAALCQAAAPMGIFGLLLTCKGVEAQAAAAQGQGNTPEVPVTDVDEVASHHDGMDSPTDCFDHCTFAPSLHENGVPVMPTVRSQGGHHERNPPFVAPFNAAVARTVGRKEVQSTPEALAACKKE